MDRASVVPSPMQGEVHVAAFGEFFEGGDGVVVFEEFVVEAREVPCWGGLLVEGEEAEPVS